MTLVLQDDGLLRKMEDVRAAWNTTKLKVHLYKSNTTPTTASVLGDFTECDFAGYAAQDISTWGAAAVAAHVCSMVAAANTFTRSSTGAAQNVYGVFVTNQASTVLYYAERDPNAPRVLTNAGDSETYTARITDQDLST